MRRANPQVHHDVGELIAAEPLEETSATVLVDTWSDDPGTVNTQRLHLPRARPAPDSCRLACSAAYIPNPGQNPSRGQVGTQRCRAGPAVRALTGLVTKRSAGWATALPVRRTLPAVKYNKMVTSISCQPSAQPTRASYIRQAAYMRVRSCLELAAHAPGKLREYIPARPSASGEYSCE
jgi:hypothetical protein